MAEIELNRREAADGDLPPVCIYCGAPAIAYRRKIFSGTTPFRRFWLHRPRAALPVCARHRRYSLRRSLLLLPPLVSFLAVLALLAELTRKELVAAPLDALVPYKAVFVGLAFVLFFALLGVALFVFYTDIRCSRLTTTTITLSNVSDRFVDACYPEDESLIEEVLPADSRAPAARQRAGRPPPSAAGAKWLLLGLGAFLFCLVCGGGLVGVFWLAGGRAGGEPIVLSNPQHTRGPGLINSIRVDYRFRRDGPAAEAHYVFIARPAQGPPQRRVYSGRELQSSGTLHLDLLGLPSSRSGLGGTYAEPFEVFVELEPAPGSAAGARLSNVLTVR